MSDSLMITATGETSERLHAVLMLSPFESVARTEVIGNSLVLHRFAYGKDTNLPVPMPAEKLADIAEAWLEEAAFGPEPDIDGSCHKGWKVEGSNMTDKIVITPHWMIYHK